VRCDVVYLVIGFQPVGTRDQSRSRTTENMSDSEKLSDPKTNAEATRGIHSGHERVMSRECHVNGSAQIRDLNNL